MERPDCLHPATSRDPCEAADTGASSVLLAPHGSGWRAESARLYVWQESRAETEDWLCALGRVPRGRHSA